MSFIRPLTSSAALRSYSTTFAADETPISEGGNWARLSPPQPDSAVHTGWHDVITVGGNAKPHFNAGSTEFDDNYAYLTGSWQPNVTAEAIVYDGGVDSSPRECELLLRVSDDSTSVRAYECLFGLGGGVDLARWNGAPGDFTSLGAGLGATGGLSIGDHIKATITGQTIEMFYSRAATPTSFTSLGTVTDNSAQKLTTGAPGIGFFNRTPLTLDFGMQSYTVTEI